MGTITRNIAHNLTSGLGGASGVNFRNMIINGDMQVAQRATSATAFNDGYGTVDRFSFTENSSGAATSEQESLTSGGAFEAGFTKAVKMSCTTADGTVGATERAYMQQSIEGQFLQQLQYGYSSAKTMTLSFWAKSNMTGNFPVTIKKDDNTIYYISYPYNITSANTWQKFSIVITPTAGSTTLITSSAAKINDDNGRGMQIMWGLAWGSNYTGSYSGTPTWTSSSNDFADSDVTYNNFFSSTSNNLSITGIQLEVGAHASDFEFLPKDINLDRCYRYFYKMIPQSGNYQNYALITYNGTSAAGFIYLPKPMRSGSLTMTTSGTFVSNTPYAGSSYDNVSSGPSLGDVCQNIIRVSVDIPNSKTGGDSGRLLILNDATAFIAVADEL
tara:strand:+ start:2397 stop:3557 length:1161 start_codon:yes stop_codon:yes gene_type:complete